MTDKQNVVIHYGVKGMRWGVRRDRSGGGETAFLNTVGKTSQKTTLKTVSNEQLQARVKRLQLEKQYVDLVSKEKERNRTTLEKGAREVNKMISNTAKWSINYVTQQNIMRGLKIAGIVPKDD